MQIEIPGYSIVSTLSQGVAATVYLALDKNPGRELALKVMPLDEGALKFPLETLVRERSRVQHLVHPNIVKILDVGIHAGHYFLAMEYLPGATLSHKRFELDLLARLRVVIDVAKALDFLAVQGYVHAGLAPENILIHAPDSRALLMGFGLKHLMTKSEKSTQFLVIGAPASPVDPCFQSPEQLQGKLLTSQSDLYSLGALLFLLLTDKPPFTALLGAEKDTVLSRSPIPQLPEHLHAFQPIIDRLLSLQPEARYRRASECVADLGALPESVVSTAIEGFERSLVQESESPLQLMARSVPAAAEDLVFRAVSPNEIHSDSEQAFFIDNDLFQPQSEFSSDTGRILDERRAPTDRGLPLTAIAVLAMFIPFAIYFGVQRFSTTSSTDKVATVTSANLQRRQPEPRTTGKIVFAVEPDLMTQATTLRARLENDFSLATDLVIIYRAALRGEDLREQVFARAGIAELQELFSARLKAHMTKKDLDAAQAERDLALWLFEQEELIPVLNEAIAAVK